MEITGKACCVICNKEKSAVRCEGCLQVFCYQDLNEHRQQLNQQLDEIDNHRNLFRQILNEQINDPKKHFLIKQIDKWEFDSIKTIQRTAKQCRDQVFQKTNEHFNQVEMNLSKLTDQMREIHHENDFNEIDLNNLKQKLTQLEKQLEEISNVSIQEDSQTFIKKISIVISTGQMSSSPSFVNNNTKWKQHGVTIAGGTGQGNQLNQLSLPLDIYVDDDDQCIYIADWENHRIVEWKSGVKMGRVVAGGNGQGNRMDQLNSPTDVIIDKKTDSLIICDCGNRRVVRWSRRNTANGQTIISDIHCSRLTMDNNGDLYISDGKKNEVRRWKIGETNGTIVAGGNGQGNQLNQLNNPTSVFVDEDHSVYVLNHDNHRVMKWLKGAKDGIVVAGGQGQGNSLTQLNHPRGVIVDHLGNVYVADRDNHRIMCWSKGSKEGRVILGGNGEGQQSNQLYYPTGISFDRQGHLYVVDSGNYRVQKFEIDLK